MPGVFKPLLFKSGDTGAKTLSGTAGDLLNILSACLIVNTVFTTADDAAFTDRTTEARSEGGIAFTLFPTPAIADRIYIGMQRTFNRAKFDLATLGIGGAYAFEYWNGSAWTALTGVGDGTSGFTQDGTISWDVPLTWAANAVNGVTLFWIRIRPTSAPSTNPTANFITVTGWTIAFGPTTNQADYHQGGGNGFYLDINDNAPGAGLAREARARGFETMSALGVGTGDFPTTVQLAAGIIIRKSATADATTRTYLLMADDRTFYLFVLTADTANNYYSFGYGDFLSQIIGDSFRTMIIGRATENSALNSVETIDDFTTVIAVATGHYLPRAYTGLGTAIQFGKHGDGVKGNATLMVGSVEFPNAPDGGIFSSPIWITEGTTGRIRGRIRGLWHFLHPFASVTDGDVFTGTGSLAGKSFLIVKGIGTTNALGLIETSDTWENN